jgi:hypothetical protein
MPTDAEVKAAAEAILAGLKSGMWHLELAEAALAAAESIRHAEDMERTKEYQARMWPS